MSEPRISDSRPVVGNPFRETAFAALHRATRELSIQRKIRLLPKIAAAAMFAILLMSISFAMLSRHSMSQIRDGYYPSARSSAELRQRLGIMQRRLAGCGVDEGQRQLSNRRHAARHRDARGRSVAQESRRRASPDRRVTKGDSWLLHAGASHECTDDGRREQRQRPRLP